MCKITVLMMEICGKLGITGVKDAMLKDLKLRLVRAGADLGEHSANVALWDQKRKRGNGCGCTVTQCSSKNCTCFKNKTVCTKDCYCAADPNCCAN